MPVLAKNDVVHELLEAAEDCGLTRNQILELIAKKKEGLYFNPDRGEFTQGRSRFAKAGSAEDCGHEVEGDPKAGKFSEDNVCAEGGGGSTEDRSVKHLEHVYERAPHAKKEIDDFSHGIAERVDHGATVAKAPVKSKKRAIEKIEQWYGGDARRLNDLVRNTIVVDNHLHHKVLQSLIDKDAKINIFHPDKDPLGYSGINATLKTEAGINAEIQINSPEMIYAKEHPSVAMLLIGKEKHEEIRRKTGVEGGLGHKFYESYRSLAPNDPRRSHFEMKSKKYYDHIRKRMAA